MHRVWAGSALGGPTGGDGSRSPRGRQPLPGRSGGGLAVRGAPDPVVPPRGLDHLEQGEVQGLGVRGTAGVVVIVTQFDSDLAVPGVFLYAPTMTSRPAESSSTPPSDPAWRAAEAYGCDMDLLEESLSLTPAERLRLHMIALRRLEQLEAAMEEVRHEPGSPA
jgi:hypothetical protein